MRWILLVLVVSVAFAQRIELDRWAKAQSFLQYLQKNHLPKELYYSLDGEEKELVSELYAGIPYYTLFDDKGSIAQVLIPINEELQIHIFRQNGKYMMDLVPIHYVKKEERLFIHLDGSPYDLIKSRTNNIRLAHEFVVAFHGSVDFSHSIHKGDRLALLYEQKYRLGNLFGYPTIHAGMVETGGKRHYIFNYKGRYYNEKGEELEHFMLTRPIPHARITSRFTLRRWHPILHRYRAHLGVDFGARRGTPVRAAGSGRVVFAGRKGGYGNVIIISHGNGYKSLYAHLSRFRKGIRRGKRVRQGHVIGYVGSTGLSTGPHLHFGLYKNNRPINPLRVVHIARNRLTGKKLRAFKELVQRYKKRIDQLIEGKEIAHRVQRVDLISRVGGEDEKRRAD